MIGGQHQRISVNLIPILEQSVPYLERPGSLKVKLRRHNTSSRSPNDDYGFQVHNNIPLTQSLSATSSGFLVESFQLGVSPFNIMLLNLLYLLAALPPSALADVKFITPAAGASIPAGGTFAVEWKDSGSAPSIADLASYQLFLCAGGNDATNFVCDLLTSPY